MQLDAALPIIRALADGINPVTGELYPDHSPYAEPRALRALYAAVDCMEKEVNRKNDAEVMARFNISSDDWDQTPNSVKEALRSSK